MDIEEFVGHLQGVRPSGGGYAALCPAHVDNRQSLSVNVGKTQPITIHCHANCPPDRILDALNLKWSDIGVAQYVAATYEYRDANGTLLYTKVRLASPKDFRIDPGLPPKAQRVLFAQEPIAHARTTGAVLYVVEGEKDALNLHARGIPATTPVCGAGDWSDHYALQLTGCHVVVIADNDEPGKAHAREVAASLKGIAKSVTLAKTRVGKDISDQLDAGLGVADLDALPLEGELTLYKGEDLTPTPTKWAWTNHMAVGAITLIEGDPGDGKSVLTCDLAARWSTGMTLPDGSANPLGAVGVVMVSAEDDPYMTISPRLRAAGADMTKVFCVTAGAKANEPFDLSAHLAALEDTVVKYDVKIIILDPLMAFIGEKTDSHNDASVRRALAPLALLARRRAVTIIVVRHLNKGTGKAIYRGGGSIGFVGAARAAYLVAPHPEEDDRRVLAPVKNNLAKKGPALVYALNTDPTYGVARVQWHGFLDTKAQELLDGAGGNEEPASEIAKYLTMLCEDKPLSWKDITAHGKSAGYTESSLRGVRSRVLVKLFGEHGNRDVVWAVKSSPPATTCGPLADHLQAPDQSLSPLTPLPAFVEADDDDKREAALDASTGCDQCGTTPAMVFAKPWYAVRCRAHNPLTYTAQS